MDLRHLTDSQLLIDTKNLAKKEREILIEVLHHLKEVCARKLFSPRYQSPYDYATKELGYSSDQAQRRLDAMRLLRDLPEIEPAIAEGSLNLTTIGIAQTFFRAEAQSGAFSKEEKLETLKSIQGQSTREATKTLIEMASEPLALKPESVRPISKSLSEIKAYIDDETLELFSKIKGILAHKHPNLSNSELIKIMATETFEKLSPGREPRRSSKPKANASSNEPNAVSPAAPRSMPSHSNSEKAPRRMPSAAISRELYRDAGGKCAQCGSHYKLQRDHKREFSLGGLSTKDNLQMLCFHCNQRKRIQKFGYRQFELR